MDDDGEDIESLKERMMKLKEILQSKAVKEIVELSDEDFSRLLRSCPKELALTFIRFVKERHQLSLKRQYLKRYVSTIINLPFDEFTVHVDAIGNYNPYCLDLFLEALSRLLYDETKKKDGQWILRRGVYVITRSSPIMLPTIESFTLDFLKTCFNEQNLAEQLRDAFKANPCVGTLLLLEGLCFDARFSINNYKKSIVRFFLVTTLDTSQATSIITHFFHT